MLITKNTRVADILREYGDIADVMEVFGIKRVGRYSIRALATKAVTVEWAARIHGVPLNEFLRILKKAVANPEKTGPANALKGKYFNLAKSKLKISHWSTIVVLLSLLLFFFALPHTLEDFATGEPAKAGIPAYVLAYVIAGMFALQGLGLLWIARQMHRGYVLHAFLGIFWPISAGVTQLPTILSGAPYRAGFISIFNVGGMLLIGVLLFMTSILALRVNQSR